MNLSWHVYRALVLATGAVARQARRLRGDERGQAVAEYSLITYAILIGAGGFGFAAKWSAFGNQSLAAVLYQALQTYVNSVNFSLSLAAT